MSEAVSDFIGFIITLTFVALISYANYRSKKAPPPPPPPPEKRVPIDQLFKEIGESVVKVVKPPPAPQPTELVSLPDPFESSVERYEEREGVAQQRLEESAFDLAVSADLISEEAEAAYHGKESTRSRAAVLFGSASLRGAVLLSEILGKPRGA